MSLATVIAAYEPHGLKKTGHEKYRALCVAHGDRNPSLDIGRGKNGDVVVFCQSRHCEPADIMAAVGLTMDDIFEQPRMKAVQDMPQYDWPVKATYYYHDSDGTEVYRILRKISPISGKKTFPQFHREGGQWVPGTKGLPKLLYRLPQLEAATEGQRVFVVEGEQCADDLAARGAIVTTCIEGAGKWLDEYAPRFRGLHVVVLPDNDDVGRDHATQVAASLAPHALSVKTVFLPDLPRKGDVSDWLRSGGTFADLEGLCSQPEQTRPNSFASAPQRLLGESDERLADRGKTLRFGITFLDDALCGIMPRDIVLVGAKTGAGKTQLATIAALTNAAAGKRVHYFALEAEDREIERRIKYQYVAEGHYAASSIPIRFLEWRAGFLNGLLGRYEERADAQTAVTLANLHTFYRANDFTADDFGKQVAALKGETDLIILDHLHYVDNDEKDENRGYKNMVKQIRDAALASGKPTIIVAHVRKSDRRARGLLPDIEDFHGSSDIPKIATKAIMIAPDYETKTDDPSLWSTYLQIVKCRTDSSLTRYAARTVFDAERDCYAEPYTLGRLSEGGTVFNELPLSEHPHWARPRATLSAVPDSRFPKDDNEIR